MPFSYSCLTLNILLITTKLYGSLAAKVSISQNITELIGNNDIPLTCSFTNNADEEISKVEFFAKNKTDEFDHVKPIALFIPDKPARLILSGNNLIGRVTLTNITRESTNATLTLHELKCEDEREYMCQCYYNDIEDVSLPPEKSPPTRISIQATSSKPDSISSFIVLSTKTVVQGYSSPIYNNFISTKHNAVLTFRTLPVDRVTTKHMQSTDNFSLTFREGDTVMFTCMGGIGDPPGKLIWQKTFPQGKKPITYSNENTDVEKILGQCSFKGTSHLTVKVYAEDIKATIRCFEESQVNVTGMYLETEPFDIQFQVNHVNINKQPNQKQYGPKSDKITLTCEGNGNPEPHYAWFKREKNNSILSKKTFYVIDNVIQNNSGVYICEVYNIIDDVIYRKSNSVEIDIVYEKELPSSQDLLKIFIVYVIPVVCVFIVICVAVMKHWCIRPKKKENEENYYQTLRHDGITVNAKSTSVSHTNNTSVGEAKDNLVCSNGKERNENNSRNKDEFQTGYLTCIQVTGSTSVNHPDNYEDLIASDRTVVYDEINQQTTMNNEVSKARMSVPTDHGDHDDVMDVAIQSSVNDG